MIIGDKYIRKCKRFDFQGQAHELTFSCFHNKNFLSKKRSCNWLIESLRMAGKKHNFSLWAYVFMPNHVHILILPKQQEYSISRILKTIKQPVATKAIHYLKQHNPDGLTQLATGQKFQKLRFWQKGGGYDHNVTEIDTLLQTIRYIHLNPVRKGFVDSPEEWFYSSASTWAGFYDDPISIDKEDWPIFT